ncbi:hypothetical protein [Bacillus cereus]|uniref:hypothetical protein n=1 Tax=Bacillus cereus TaxID=1396 RepID=UPI00159BF03B|nr:hypothetical protein [Bacillus cereus]
MAFSDFSTSNNNYSLLFKLFSINEREFFYGQIKVIINLVKHLDKKDRDNWYWSNGKPIISAFDLNIERLIITPGANKYRNGYDTPFDIHRVKANSAIDTASKFIIIGYGFNDEHLETLQRDLISNSENVA